MASPEAESPRPSEYRLNSLQGLDALIRFLEEYGQYNPSSSRVIDGMLNLLYYSTVDNDGVPNTGDPNIWSDWLEAIEQALAQPRVQDSREQRGITE